MQIKHFNYGQLVEVFNELDRAAAAKRPLRLPKTRHKLTVSPIVSYVMGKFQFLDHEEAQSIVELWAETSKTNWSFEERIACAYLGGLSEWPKEPING